MIVKRFLIIVAVLLGFTSVTYGVYGCHEEQGDGIIGMANQTDRVQSGDLLIIELNNISRLRTVQVIVDKEGYIRLPSVGFELVKGKTLGELASHFQERYVRDPVYRNICVAVKILPQEILRRFENVGCPIGVFDRKLQGDFWLPGELPTSGHK
jgi:hypothetical protein